MNRRRGPEDDPYWSERSAPRHRSPYSQEDQVAATGWYEPDAQTIEMPIIDENLLQQTGPHVRSRPVDSPRAPTRRPPAPPGRRRPGAPGTGHDRAPAAPGAPGPPGMPGPPGSARAAGTVRRPPGARRRAREPQPSSDQSSRLVAAAIFLSRLAGLARESVAGYFLGIGPAADAFKAALRIPNMLQNLLSDGVLSASFIPVYARLRDEGKEREAGRLAGAIAGLLLVLTGLVSVIGVVFAEPITKVLVTGFTPATFDLTVRLVRIMFPGIGLLVLSAWCLGVLNSHRKFFLSYIAPVLWNAAQIATLVAAAMTTDDQVKLATALAWGVLLGGLLQLLVQLRPVLGLLGRLQLSLDAQRASVRNVLGRFVPVVIGKGVVQVIIYIDLWLASFLASGAVSALFVALLLYQLPISMFGLGVAAAELPDLSSVSVHDPETRREFRQRIESGMARIAFYVLPIATMYVVVGDVIIGVIFERGEFKWDDTWGVWLALAVFSLGLPATTSSRLLQNALFALDDPKTPPRLSVIRVVISTVVSLAIMFPLDRLTIGPDGIEGWGDIFALGPLSRVAREDGLVHLGFIAFAVGATVAAMIEYRMLARAVAWRIGRTRMAGRWLNPIAGSCAAAGAVAFALVTVLPGSWPSLILAPLVLAPAGVVYLLMTRSLQVPESVAVTGRLESILARRP